MDDALIEMSQAVSRLEEAGIDDYGGIEVMVLRCIVNTLRRKQSDDRYITLNGWGAAIVKDRPA